eukprot:5132708-Pleurochrysis_carterae.AAC.5
MAAPVLLGCAAGAVTFAFGCRGVAAPMHTKWSTRCSAGRSPPMFATGVKPLFVVVGSDDSTVPPASRSDGWLEVSLLQPAFS